MNKAKFLSLLAKFGYKAADGLDDAKRITEVKSFIKDNGIELRTADGEAVDVDAVFAKKTVFVMADAGESVEMVEPPAEVETESAMEEEPEAVAPKSARPAQKFAAINANSTKSVLNSPDGIKRLMARKRYTARIAAGQAYIPDADYAEKFGAFMRYHSAPGDYKEKSWDAEILGKTGTTTNNAAIGALIPEEYSAVVMDIAERFGVALRIANVVKMARDTWTGPRSTAYMSLTHTGEGVASTAADPAYDNVTLVAKTARGLSKISFEALEDSAINVADEYGRQYGIAYARRIDQDWILGDGTSTYGGHVGLANALPTSAYVAGAGTWAATTMPNLIGATGAIENVGDNTNIAFVCSRQFYVQVLQRLAQAQGGVTSAEIINGVGQAKGPDATYQGWPVYFAQVAPTATAASAKGVYYGDFRAASMIGVRSEFRIRTSEERYFDENNFAILAVARFSVNVHGDGRASTFGPVTCLANS